jgi:hypothetical protein
MNPVSKHLELLKEASKNDPMYKFLDPGILGDIYKPFVEGFTPSPELRVEQTEKASAP